MSKLVNSQILDLMLHVCNDQQAQEIEQHIETLSSYDRFIHHPFEAFDTLICEEQVRMIYEDLKKVDFMMLCDSLVKCTNGLKTIERDLVY